MKKRVVIIGASGHGKVVADIVIRSGDQVVGFLDDNPELGTHFMSLPLLGKVGQFQQYKECWFVVAIGNATVREKIVAQLGSVKWYTALAMTTVPSPMDTPILDMTADG